MNEYMMGFAIAGALLVAAPAMFADYELFKEWREENGAVYDDGSEVITILTIGKDGVLGSYDGSLYTVISLRSIPAFVCYTVPCQRLVPFFVNSLCALRFKRTNHKAHKAHQ